MNVICAACSHGFDLRGDRLDPDAVVVCPECLAEFTFGQGVQLTDSGDGTVVEADVLIETNFEATESGRRADFGSTAEDTRADADAGALDPQEVSGLSPVDLSVIGVYHRHSRDLSHATEDVWAGAQPAAKKAQSSARPVSGAAGARLAEKPRARAEARSGSGGPAAPGEDATRLARPRIDAASPPPAGRIDTAAYTEGEAAAEPTRLATPARGDSAVEFFEPPLGASEATDVAIENLGVHQVSESDAIPREPVASRPSDGDEPLFEADLSDMPSINPEGLDLQGSGVFGEGEDEPVAAASDDGGSIGGPADDGSMADEFEPEFLREIAEADKAAEEASGGGIEDMDFEAFLAEQSAEISIPTVEDATRRRAAVDDDSAAGDPGGDGVERSDVGIEFTDLGVAAEPEAEPSMGEASGEVFFVESPSLTSLGPEEQQLLESMRLGTEDEPVASAASQVLELDVGPGEGPLGVEDDPSAPAGARDAAPRGRTRVGPTFGLPRRQRARVGLVLGAIFFGVILAAGGAYVLVETGVIELGSKPSGQRPLPSTNRKAAAKFSTTVLNQDTPEAYKAEIQRLEKLGAKYGNDPAVREQIARLYARFRERFPVDFQKDPVMVSRWKKVRGALESDAAKTLLRAMDLLAAGDEMEALKLLQEYVSIRSQDPQILYLIGKVHFAKKRYGEAEKAFRRLLAADRNDVRAAYFLGKILATEGKIDEAEKVLQRVFKLNPDHLDGRLELARVFLERSRYDKAREQASQVVEMGRQKKVLSAQFEGHRLLARIYAALNETKKQVAELQFALKVRETEAIVLELAAIHSRHHDYRRMGESLLRCAGIKCKSEPYFVLKVRYLQATAQFGQAATWVDKALGLFPDSTALHLLKGRLAERLDQYKNAKSEYEKVVALSPGDADAYVRLAEISVKERDHDTAESVLKSGLGRVGNKVPLLEKLVDVYELKKEPGARRATLRQLVDLDPANPDYRLKLAVAYKQLAMYEEALQQFVELQRLAKVSEAAVMGYIDTLLRVGRLDEARTEATKYFRDHQASASAAIMLGEIHLGLKEYPDAEKYLSAALKIEGRNPQAHYLLAKVYTAQRLYDKAIEHLRSAVTEDEKNPEYHFEFARALLAHPKRLKRFEQEALVHLNYLVAEIERKRLSLANDRQAHIFHTRGNIYYRRGRMQRAFADFTKALNLDTESLTVLVDYGKALYQRGKYRDAERYLREVVRKDPYSPEANLYLGKIGLKTRRRQFAEDHFKRTVKRGGKTFPAAYKDLGYIYWEKGLRDLARSNFRKYLSNSSSRPIDADEIERMITRR